MSTFPHPDHPGLFRQLIQHSSSGSLPMHMPGHKRNMYAAPYLAALGGEFDITEISGFDNLHQAEGILKQGMDRAARLWGSDASYFLVGGSTCGILAGVHAAARRGGTVLLARNCHQSVYHAIELCGLTPRFLVPPMDDSFGICGSLPPSLVDQALHQHPDTALLIFTSPTYDGVLSDVEAICRIAHDHNVSVLVDEAHGAHLGFSSAFPGGAVKAGADLVIQSLHKTLPSLTQTAIAHLNGTRISQKTFGQSLRMFETSSPSYLLLASIDECVHLLETNPALFSDWHQALEQFHREIGPLQHLRVLGHGADRARPHPTLFRLDPGKLLISTLGTPYTGPQLMEQLREQFAIELEMAAAHSALAMTGLGTTEEHLHRLAQALCILDKSWESSRSSSPPGLPSLPLPRQAMPPWAARSRQGQLVPMEQAAGHVSGEYLWAYPPGIPLLIPGEVISAPLLEEVRRMNHWGIPVHSTSGGMPNQLLVLEKAHETGEISPSSPVPY